MTRDLESSPHKLENQSSFNLQFTNISYRATFKAKAAKRDILKNVSGKFYNGRLTAILGPSGAGKSSLLKILSGSRPSGAIGSVEVDGEPMENYDTRSKCALIAQDFAMLPKLTVLETLYVAANLKLSTKVSAVEKQKIVSNIVSLLGFECCLSTLVDRLSGGEKKRLSIGVELITNPPLMLFDEPTSGLDSVSSLHVIKYLRALAHEHNVAIVAIIHQPSSSLFQLFDDVYVMSHGECLYGGPLDNMLTAFKEAGYECPQYYNRADFALDIASRPRDPKSEALRNKSSRLDDSSTRRSQRCTEKSKLLTTKFTGSLKRITSHHYPVPFYKQFNILLRRTFLCAYRDLMFAQLRVAAHLLVGVLIGIVFYNMGNEGSLVMPNISGLFFILLFVFFANAMPVVVTFPAESRVFQREYFNNWYSIEMYYLSKLFAELPLQLICPFICISVAYYLTGQPIEVDRFLMVLGICTIQGMIGHAIGLLAGIMFSLQVGIFCVPAISVPMLMFSGFFIKSGEMLEFLRPVAGVCFFRFSFENTVIAILGFDRQKMECTAEFCYFKSPKNVLDLMQINENDFDFNATMLVLWYLGLQVCVYAALKIRVRRCN